jgi:hypothetical protein
MCLHPLSLVILALFFLIYGCLKLEWIPLIVHFLNAQWEPCHIIVGLFEIADTTKSAMALQVIDVLAKHGLITR